MANSRIGYIAREASLLASSCAAARQPAARQSAVRSTLKAIGRRVKVVRDTVLVIYDAARGCYDRG